MKPESDEIIVDVRDHVAIITMNRPEKLNSLTPDMEEQLKIVFKQCQDDDDVRVLILTGAGKKGFCSGFDVKNLIDVEGKPKVFEPGQTIPTPSPSNHVPRFMFNTVEKPVIAAVNGVAAGEGYCLSLASDIRFASENARFVHVYLRRALVGSGETWWLARLIGLGPAMYHILSADEVDAEEALRLNLISKIVPAEKLLEEAFAFAQKLAAWDPTTMKFTKKAIRKGLTLDYESTMEWAGYFRRVANPSGAGQIAMESFLRKE